MMTRLNGNPNDDRVWADGLASRPAAEAERELRQLDEALARRDDAAVDRALTYLEVDPWYFRSGYAKQRLLDRLRSQSLDREQRSRLMALVVRAVDEGTHRYGREFGRLVRKFATNDLRRTLRARMQSPDQQVSWRATWLFLRARHPGLDASARAIARENVRRQAARFTIIDHNARRLATRLWSPEWQAQLRALAKERRDPGARRLLEADRQRQRIREWAASRRRASAAPGVEAASDDGR